MRNKVDNTAIEDVCTHFEEDESIPSPDLPRPAEEQQPTESEEQTDKPS